MKKRDKIIYWAATLWLALGMTATGLGQVFKNNGQGGLDMMHHLGYPTYLLVFIGVCKIAGVVVLFMPKLPLLKEWAYAGFGFLMLGAIYSHLAIGEPLTSILPALLLLILGGLSWQFRPASKKITLNTVENGK